MSELTIYDSQGAQIGGDGEGRVDERVKDFFFDGVRFALDMRLSNEAIVFFRARENETARSEQYYAVYNFERQSEISDLGDEVRQVIEGEWDMLLETDPDDVEVFDLLVGDRSDEYTNLACPGRLQDVEDLKALVNKGRPITVGVGSYREACGVLNEFLSEDGVNQVAIADDVSGSSLESYDLVVEVGSYRGLEPIGDTGEALETLRERRRQEQLPDDADTAPDNPVLALLKSDSRAIDAAFVTVVILLLAGGGVFGACTFGVIGEIPVVDHTCGDGGAVLTSLDGEFNETSERLVISGNASANGTYEPNVTVANETDTVFDQSAEINVTNGTFTHAIEGDGLTPPPAGDYTVNVSLNGASNETTITVPASESSANLSKVSAGLASSDEFVVTGETDRNETMLSLSFSAQTEGADASYRRQLAVETDENGTFSEAVDVNVSEHFEPETPVTVTVQSADDNGSDSVMIPSDVGLSALNATVSAENGTDSAENGTDSAENETLSNGELVLSGETDYAGNESKTIQIHLRVEGPDDGAVRIDRSVRTTVAPNGTFSEPQRVRLSSGSYDVTVVTYRDAASKEVTVE